MPRYHHNPTGLLADLPERLSQRETRVLMPAACSGDTFGPRHPDSVHLRPESGILQWVIAKSPWAHPTRDLARVKGRNLEIVHSLGALGGTAFHGADL